MALAGYKADFIRLMADCGVLTFGDFTLKSGRKSPYFLNAGNYNTGEQLAKLGEFYADCIQANNIDANLIFGPAYKGIPLAVATVTALYGKYARDLRYCFDRKEEKDHGEGGWLVGKTPSDSDSLIIIDDVTTSGKALREVLPKIRRVCNPHIAAFIISADRMEKAPNSDLSSVQQIEAEFGFPVYSIVNINDVIEAIECGVISGAEYLDAMRTYREVYGVE
jgi:orotate phosphoribosyltransferase